MHRIHLPIIASQVWLGGLESLALRGAEGNQDNQSSVHEGKDILLDRHAFSCIVQ